MYDPPRRRRGHGVVGARARLVPADAHVGTPADFLRRHEAEAAKVAGASNTVRTQFASRLLQRTVDPRNLKCAWAHLAAGDGQSPGIDAMRYDDLDEDEVWG